MARRTISSHARSGALQLTDLLGSLFALELLTPSTTLYLTSPWISDVPLLDSPFGQFRSILPELGIVSLGLAGVLNTLAARGTNVRIMCRPDHTYTDGFLSKLHPAIERRTGETLHEKGLVTEHFYLRGSMNFTYAGINLNDEHIELDTDIASIAAALLSAQQRWEAM